MILGKSFGKQSVLAGLVLCSLAFGAGARGDDDRAARESDTTRVTVLDLSGSPLEREPELAYLFGAGEKRTLLQVIGALRGLVDNPTTDSVVVRLKDAELSQTQVEELSAAIREVRESGKRVHVYSDGYDASGLLLASACDEVIGQDGAGVSLPGMYMEEMFLADTLRWAGLRADFVQVGDYKGASEMFARSAPSKEWDQNISQLLDSLYSNLRGPILRGRKLSEASLDGAMEQLWMAETKDAAKAGLVDSVIDLPALGKHLEKGYGAKVSWKKSDLDAEASGGGLAEMSNPFAMFGMLSQKPRSEPTGDAIAVVHIDGPIVDGESSYGGMFGGGGSVGSRTIRNALEDVRKNSDYKGVVLRINSPGGSATASEVIWQGVRRVAEKKPVWVSVGSMAASGGYYIAVSGSKIYVNPSSIVGSIGVVGGKISMEELYKKLHVGVVGRGRGPMSHMFASNLSWSDADKERVRAKMSRTYELFTQRVSAGREGIDLTKTAEGRLFTGDKAIGLRMADAIGGLQVALDDMAEELDLEDYEVMHLPAGRSLEEILQDSFGNVSSPVGLSASPMGSEALGAARALLGEKAWGQVAPAITGLMQLRDEHVVLMSPRVLIFK
jgi:protease-4